MILVVGATGMVGSEICRRLVARGDGVRGLVRPASDPGKVAALRSIGVETVVGDLRDGSSLDAACRNADTVITTVSAMPFSYVSGENDIQTVDLDGTRRLIGAATDAGISHFVHTSFSMNIGEGFPLGDAKRAVEETLRNGTMRYTILRPSCFMEAWLGPVVGFDYANARATVYGAGDRGVSYIAVADVAEIAVRSTTTPAAWNRILEMGGPEPVSQIDAVRIFERVSGRTFEVTHVPEDAVQAQEAAATDPMQRSFAALMRAVSRGDPIDMAATLAAIPMRLTSVTEYAERVLGKLPVHAG